MRPPERCADPVTLSVKYSSCIPADRAPERRTDVDARGNSERSRALGDDHHAEPRRICVCFQKPDISGRRLQGLQCDSAHFSFALGWRQ